jgi:hypothetical protein
MFPDTAPLMHPGCEPGPAPKLERVLVWLRRDLRVDDNPALTAALQIAKQVVSLSRTFLFHALPLPCVGVGREQGA